MPPSRFPRTEERAPFLPARASPSVRRAAPARLKRRSRSAERKGFVMTGEGGGEERGNPHILLSGEGKIPSRSEHHSQVGGWAFHECNNYSTCQGRVLVPSYTVGFPLLASEASSCIRHPVWFPGKRLEIICSMTCRFALYYVRSCVLGKETFKKQYSIL